MLLSYEGLLKHTLNRQSALILCCLASSTLFSGCLKIPGKSNEKGGAAIASSSQPEVVVNGSGGGGLKIPPHLSENGTSEDDNRLDELKGLKGVKTTHLFSEGLNDQGHRIDRLENVVSTIHKEFETVKPAIVRLVSIEKDIQELIKVLSDDSSIPDEEPEFLLDDAEVDGGAKGDISDDEVVKDVPAVPVEKMADHLDVDEDMVPQNVDINPAPKVKKSVAAVDVDAHNDPKIKRVRSGTHPDFTRIVIDISEEIDNFAMLNEYKSAVVITLPKNVEFDPDVMQLLDDAIEGHNTEIKGEKRSITFNLIENAASIKHISYYDPKASTYKVLVDIFMAAIP